MNRIVAFINTERDAVVHSPGRSTLPTTTFAEGPMRDRVLGLNGALLSGGFTVGTLIAGFLVSLLSWRAAFVINVPVAVVILLLVPFLISESRRQS